MILTVKPFKFLSCNNIGNIQFFLTKFDAMYPKKIRIKKYEGTLNARSDARDQP